MTRGALAVLCGSIVGAALFRRYPFPDHEPMARLLEAQAGWLFYTLRYSWQLMMFTTPTAVFSLLLSFGFVFTRQRERAAGTLPPFPRLQRLGVVLGEVHHARRVERAEHPNWLVIPERGLYTGICMVGAIGSGKTTGAMRPYARQILEFAAAERERRAAGIVLEVKGDFCDQVREILQDAGRGDDYVEIGMDTRFVYNPLNNDQDAFSLAYSIASLLTNLYGRGKEPFWQQAYTNLVKFVILLHKVVDGYCTLFQVYECAINPDRLKQKISEGEAMFARYAETTPQIVIDPLLYVAHDELADRKWETSRDGMRTPYAEDLVQLLEQWGAVYTIEEPEPLPENFSELVGQFEATKRWFTHDWSRIDTKLRSSIVEGISVFLSLFDDNPQVKRIFCPPREAFDPVANADGRYGAPLPPFADLIESGKVLALNMPAASNTATARAIGCMLKLDFQRAMLQRIPKMATQPERQFRPVLFLCDEYQAFATVGESDPSGDEKFFALSRQSKCIPIVATQSISSLKSALPGESWRTLMQTFRTKVFLCLSDDFSAKVASDLCGRDEQMTPNWSISESGHDVRVGMLSGKALAHKAGLTINKSYNLQWRPVFEAKRFMELQNAQAIVLAYDGVNPLPAQLCYLKPHYLDRNWSYFDQLERGVL